MKSWRETSLVFNEIARLSADGQACALATLIKVEGSSYRRPGAKLLIREDGSLLGNVSGGCLENDLSERALRVMRTGQAELVHYDTGADENVVWGLGLGCNGKIDLHLQPAPVDQVGRVREQLGGDAPFELRAGDFVEKFEPPPKLVVVGAGEDAVTLVRLAAEAGFRVWIVDHRAAALRPENFPGAFRLLQARPESGAAIPSDANTLVVIKNHHLDLDRGWVLRFVDKPVRYIGLLGPKTRRDEILKSLNTEHRTLIYGPIGLDLGAEGPEQIALSIVAELLAVAASRTPGHLRDRSMPIH